MKLLLIIQLLMMTSCSSYVRTLGTRMLSPEAQGGLGHGYFETRFQSQKREKIVFEDTPGDYRLKGTHSDYNLQIFGAIGFFEKLDFYLQPSIFSGIPMVGMSYQFMGEPKTRAKKGNWSLSAFVSRGHLNERVTNSGDLSDYINGNLKEVENDTSLEDYGLVVGYRWTPSVLQYVNGVYVHQNVEGKVSTKSGTLNREPFEFEHFGTIYSTGLIHYFAKAHWKLDYSHFISDWTRGTRQTINSINLAIGFDW